MESITENMIIGSTAIPRVINSVLSPSTSGDVEIDILCKKIKELLTKKKPLGITDIMEEFNISADKAVIAVKKLKQEGIVREVD